MQHKVKFGQSRIWVLILLLVWMKLLYQKLLHLEKNDPRLRIGYYPVFPDVHVSLTVFDGSSEAAEQKFAAASAEIQALLADYIYGADDESMAAAVGQLLATHNKTMAVAESCTGGLIAHKITSVAGSSEYFTGGVVAYSNRLKELYLGAFVIRRDVALDECPVVSR